GGDEREHGPMAADDEGVAGVVPALEARHGGGALGEEIHDLALAFIAPLGADDDHELSHAQPLTKNRMRMPISMLPRPAKRNSRSCTCKSRAKARLTSCGLRKGAMPSNTKNRPSAARRSERLSDTGLRQAAAVGG